MAFQAKTLDFNRSPYTGFVRQTWIEAGEYLLEGAFSNIRTPEDPMIVPRTEISVTYPHLGAPENQLERERRAERFEGLTRTFFIAAPLIKDRPGLTVHGLNLREYYKNHILRSCTPKDPLYVGDYRTLQRLTGQEKNAHACFQQTVETCALVIGLWITEEQIWSTYTKKEKGIIADFLSDYAHSYTVPQNWRLFNMLDLAFLHQHGYRIDRNIMRDHAMSILNYYAGNGWYRDGMGFDYYSCWAFQFYGPLWCDWYGYAEEPELAEAFEKRSNELMKTYDRFFDEKGHVNMWGRSSIYRCAATSAFDGNFFLKNSTADPGLARRISSGALLQFLGREDFLVGGVPSLGWYRQFSPLVQGYSCAESPYWLGKAFLCLHLPADPPFWTARENNGVWSKMHAGEVTETLLGGPGMCISNHASNGATILRTSKVEKGVGDLHGMWNYSKLCYHTAYPWEATPQFDPAGRSIAVGQLQSQQYTVYETDTKSLKHANVTFYSGQKNGVFYRRQYFDYDPGTENCWLYGINLADFPVPYGLLRVDRHRIFRRPVEFTLGSYGFPDPMEDTRVQHFSQGSYNENLRAQCIVLKGHDAEGREKQMAMTVYGGWQELDLVKSEETNPDSAHSIVLYAHTALEHEYDSREPYLFISQVLTREDHEDFTQEELFPIRELVLADSAGTGGFGPIVLKMQDGTEKTVDFDQMEGKLML